MVNSVGNINLVTVVESLIGASVKIMKLLLTILSAQNIRAGNAATFWIYSTLCTSTRQTRQILRLRTFYLVPTQLHKRAKRQSFAAKIAGPLIIMNSFIL